MILLYYVALKFVFHSIPIEFLTAFGNLTISIMANPPIDKNELFLHSDTGYCYISFSGCKMCEKAFEPFPVTERITKRYRGNQLSDTRKIRRDINVHGAEEKVRDYGHYAEQTTKIPYLHMLFS